MPADHNKATRRLAVIPFLFLIYLIYPITTLLQSPPRVQVTGFVLLAGFATCYVHGFFKEKYRFPDAMVLIAVIIYFALACDLYMILLGFFSAGIISQIRSSKQFWLATGIELAAFAAIFLFSDRQFLADNFYSMLPPFIIILFFPFGLRILLKSRLLKKELSFANEEIARLGIIEERQRISRDLHDTLGHTLSLITLKSELAEKLLAKAPEKAAAEIRDIQNTARTALRQVRELVADMGTITVKDELLNTKRILQTAGIGFSIREEDLSDAPPLTQSIMGLCLREAVNNVVKHSGAALCEITLSQSSREWKLLVTDSGRRTGPEAGSRTAAKSQGGIAAMTPGSSGYGLIGMQERLKLIQGLLSFTKQNSGSSLEVIIPKIIKESGQSNG